MDFGLLISNSLKPSPNAPNGVILTKKNTDIGRHGDVRIDTSKTHEISKHHAAIQQKETRGKKVWILEDKKSMNSTFLNCKKIRRHLLKQYDEIIFGAGTGFCEGDIIDNSDNAECRYIFTFPDPPVYLKDGFDVNITLIPEEDCEECCICYMPMLVQTNLACGHSFCRKCLSDWAKKCDLNEQPFVCPICRTEFDRSVAKTPSLIISEDRIVVQTVEPFFRKLGIRNFSELRNHNIFNEWTPEMKEKFWNFHSKIKDSPHKLLLFADFTSSSYRRIKIATHAELEIARSNFEIDNSLFGEKLRAELIYKAGTLVYKIKARPKTEPTHHHRTHDI